MLATLVYLALQVRQSKELLLRQQKIAQSQVHQAGVSDRIAIEMKIVESAELAELIVTAAGGIGSLSPIDRLKLRAYASANLAIQENNLYQYELGLIDDATLAGANEDRER